MESSPEGAQAAGRGIRKTTVRRKDPLRNPAGHWIDFCKRRAQQEDG